jgi:hypothetical protein
MPKEKKFILRTNFAQGKSSDRGPLRPKMQQNEQLTRLKSTGGKGTLCVARAPVPERCGLPL